MNLTDQINEDIKAAMKEKNKAKLEALRAIKSALLLASTEKGAKESSEAAELKMLQKLVKQRRDAADIYTNEGRNDLAAEELEQVTIIENYLPEQMTEEQIRSEVDAIIKATGANSMKDMGKVMGQANQKLAGKADGNVIAQLVKRALAHNEV
ncbi:MAG: glutamyl-tRNA amidotransferase [Flavobacteriales bacterium]|nr:glutamyl-tRNA amidotransferase [Flavobacteriales bacterium]|tara:strand:+ start:89285 stop:89743 length:459 start_codon:yes stop_codon:yes gene_type:complete